MDNLLENQEKKETLRNSIDNDIYEYIRYYKSGVFDDVLKEDSRWEVFYHLSSMREGILNWYDFGGNSNLLEIGGGFGALTGLFCRKCSHVVTLEPISIRAKAIAQRHHKYKNLDIYQKNIIEFQTQEKFDFIIAVGILETWGKGEENKSIYSNFFKCVQKFLKPKGKIIFAVENRYAIRYFCGAPEPYSGIPFEGINKFPQKLGEGYLFDRHEITEILKMSGVNKYKFYYPFPDYKIPQLVYSDNYIKGINIRERLIPYYLNKNTLIASEMDLYVDLINNNVLPFFANAFLIECFDNNCACDINYVTISEDRGKENGFLTAICDGNVVRKKALYKEGIINLKKSYENIMTLEERGIKVIKHRLIDDSLEMPFEESITCSNYLLNNFKEKPNTIFTILEKLYKYILKSSEISNEKCFLDNIYGKLEWGSVLKKAYIDMVPVNCFYKDDDLYFFDQEFSIDYCPAKFVMYRAIKYTYVYIKDAEKYIPMQSVKNHFEITEKMWEIFEEVEKKFILGNRNQELYKNYYKWTGINRKKIAMNAEQLLNGIQNVNNKSEHKEIKISDEILQVQKILRDLLQKFVQVCSKYNLQYFLFYGSLLGAIRNGGIIPWDDDIDVVMPRDDYNRLLQISQEEFVNIYFLQQPRNDKRCFYGGYSKLRNCNTSGFESSIGHAKGNQGIAIDIFPLDNVEEDNSIRKKRFDKIRNIQKILFVQTYENKTIRLKNVTEKELKYCKRWAKILPREVLCKKLDTLLEKENSRNTELCGVLARYYEENQNRLLFNKAFSNFIEIDFDGLNVRIPIGFEQCLKTLYGKSYMKLPPIEKRVPSHKYQYFVDIPFTKFWNEDFYVEGKTIVLYGHGELINSFMEKYPSVYWPEFIIDDDEGMWGRNQMGIIIYSPEKIKEISSNKLQLIICDKNFSRKICQLKKMGIENFYFMKYW